MFNNLGLHIDHFPSGKYGYIGSIPTALATVTKADTAAVMGGRAWQDDTGALVMWKFPLFDTYAAALEFAQSKGFIVKAQGK